MEAAILQFFEGIRNPFLDVLFGVFSLLGEATVAGGLAVLAFWLLPRRRGEQIISGALFSFPLNSLIKFTAARPRPFTKNIVEYREPFFADELDPNASFPSGHTQSSGSALFATASAARRTAVWILSGCTVLLVMIARMYFGAHYPTDVLAGLLFGLFIALAWGAVFRYAHEFRYLILLGLAAIFLVPCLFPNAAHDYIQAAGLISGSAVALGAAHFCVPEHTAPFPRRLWRIPVGAALVGAVFALCMLLPEGAAFSLIKWFSVAFTAGAVAPFFFERLNI